MATDTPAPTDHRESKLDRILENQSRYEQMLCDPKKGLIVKVDQLNARVPDNLPVRLDRLEQAHSLIKWLGGTAIGAIIVAAIATVGSLFAFRGGGAG